MGRIVMTIAGPWREPPELDTNLEGAELSFGPADAELAREMEAFGQRANTLSPEDISALARHQGLIGFEVEFEGPYKRQCAQAALRFAGEAMALGGAAVYVETGAKVFGSDAFQRLDPRDPSLLLHFFVEVLGDRALITTEGLQAFDLPDVAVRYTDDAAGAQAAAFGLAAKMVCDRFKPGDGGAFRATESASVYTVARELAQDQTQDQTQPTPDAELYPNPNGRWLLTPR